ncbi:hypothetical protein DPMN_073612 [Dreissena polymorpha]|uniref:Calcium-activated potassium channel BK alpha subunit domain-containing protein n=1 Tax=Dreissena polymorpha TaxID=45954 RepID=A0A9D4BZC1_DREPO|nr:hypothetical protein DPMN_073612 [Dreissena polymorpha]
MCAKPGKYMCTHYDHCLSTCTCNINYSDGAKQADKWQHTYGRHSGNEIYHIQLGGSLFFSSYEGKTFTEASADAHQR